MSDELNWGDSSADAGEAPQIESPAVSVIDKAANIYWDKIKNVPAAVKRLSMHDLRCIFIEAVTPSIDEVRRLDREGTNETISELQAENAGLKSDTALADMATAHQRGLRESCEIALSERDNTIAALRKEVEGLKKMQASHAACDAFWDYWKENGETHKHGYYESTWGAIRAYLKKASETEDQRATLPEAFPELDESAQGIMGMRIGEGE